MRNNWIVCCMVIFLLSACNSHTDNASSQTDSLKVAEELTVLAVTRQYLTTPQGNVTENDVEATLSYNNKQFNVAFRNNKEKSFSLEIESIDRKAEGVLIKTKSSKFPEIFITNGKQPQVNFNSETGENMTMM